MIELEHHIGQATLTQGAAVHPSGEYLYAAGANILSASLDSQSKQRLCRSIHNSPVSCLTVSPTGRYVASAQSGEEANVYVWDYVTEEVLYTLEEHDNCVEAVAFSHDERILATLGGQGDCKLILWDMSNGMIVSSNARMPDDTVCLAHGGFVRDVKRRDTHKYLLSTAGKGGVRIWELDPFSGQLESFPALAEARGTTSRQVTSISFAHDRDKLFAATTTGDFLVVNVKTRKVIGSVVVAKAALLAILAYRYGLVVSCADCSLKVYDNNCEYRWAVSLPHAGIALSPSANYADLLVMTQSGTALRVNLLAPNSGAVVLAESHTASITAVAWSDELVDKFATASHDGTIKCGTYTN